MATIMQGSSPKRHQSNASGFHAHQKLPAYNYRKASMYTRSNPPYYQETFLSSTNQFHFCQKRQTSLSPGNLQKQFSYGTGKRPSSVGPTSNLSGYWLQSAREMNPPTMSHQKHRTAVDMLNETKPMYMKPGSFEQRYQDTMHRNHSLNDFDKRSACCREEDFQLAARHGSPAEEYFPLKYRYPRSKFCMEKHSVGSRGSLNKKPFPLMDKDIRSYGTKDSLGEYENCNELEREYLYKSMISSGPKILHGHTAMTASYSENKCSPDEPLVLTENYRPISPPAEYATEPCYWTQQNRNRQSYKRSFSHSQETSKTLQRSIQNFNLDSHKSLPDLYSQSNRHSPHSEILSCCGRGNRSVKSIDESSFNRDSGGSSGHFTGSKSEPCCRKDVPMSGSRKACCEIRRDSGSSTQHSSNSIFKSLSPSGQSKFNCIDCMNKPPSQDTSSDFSFNFLTAEVPVQFQDGYIPTASPPKGFKLPINAHLPKSPMINKNEQQMLHSQGSLVPSPDSVFSIEESHTPPPIQFKRQKCIRFKNRNRSIAMQANLQNMAAAPVPSDCKPYSIYEEPLKVLAPEAPCPAAMKPILPSKEKEFTNLSESSSLEKFFDRLGLNDDLFQEIYMFNKRKASHGSADSDHSSTVFFSDVSTVDSMRLPDSTETNSQANAQAPTYRPTEPPSIVERNARIIKWLCNCRKSQYTHLNVS